VAQDYGYPFAFNTLGVMALIPFFLYLFFVPETLPDYVRPQPEKQRRRLALLLLRKLNDQQLRISQNAPPSLFRRQNEDDDALREELNPNGFTFETIRAHHRPLHPSTELV
jgi:hypothetical protein